MSNKKSLITMLVVLLMGLALAACNAATPAQTAAPGQQPGTVVTNGGITVVGQGTAYGQPDQATVVVGVDTFARPLPRPRPRTRRHSIR